jgi:NAD(P)-dependent dehydrogenase (short-subunit alcohol dehydrogenase family)
MTFEGDYLEELPLEDFEAHLEDSADSRQADDRGDDRADEMGDTPQDTFRDATRKLRMSTATSAYDAGLAGSLEGQIIAVTDAESGYGRSISLALAQRGATVVLLSNNSESASGLASHIENLGGTAIPIKADLSSPADYAAAQNKVLELYGHLSGVVHLADKSSPSQFDFVSMMEWSDLFAANVRSSLSVLQNLRRQLPHTWLILVGSAAEWHLHLHVVRGALEALTKGASLEKMRVNLLIPNRVSGGEAYDSELCELIAAFANPRLAHIGGNIIEVKMPPAPRIQDADLMIDVIPENLL